MSVETYTDSDGITHLCLGTLTEDVVEIDTNNGGVVARRHQCIENATATVAKAKTITGSLSELGVAMQAGHDVGQTVREAEDVADSGLSDELAGYLSVSGVEVEL